MSKLLLLLAMLFYATGCATAHENFEEAILEPNETNAGRIK